MINGNTLLIAHLGYPTGAFKAPMIYNPWFEKQGIDAVVVPMGVKAADFPSVFRQLFQLTNIRGALITMPHKISVTRLVDALTPAAQIAGACNAVVKRDDGTLLGDQFDGAGFVRGLARKGCPLSGSRAMVFGCGGVGSAIAASLAAAGIARLSLHDTHYVAATQLAERIRAHHPELEMDIGPANPAEHDVLINATPLGMNEHDPLPFDIDRIRPQSWVGDVVMKSEYTPLLRAAAARGCRIQIGADMLYEMIPAYLEFFGLGSATAQELRTVAQLSYS